MPRGKRLSPDDVIGKTFGRLTITNTWRDATHPYTRWVACTCACGNSHVARHCNVVAGLSKSCGCLFRERLAQTGHGRRTHGRSRGDPLYQYWNSLRGKRLMGDEWATFDAFMQAVGPQRPPGLFLLRKDPTKPFSPANDAGWGLATESRRQGNNARLIKIGNETRLSSEWANMAGVTRQAFQQWYDNGVKTDKELADYVYDHDKWRAKVYRDVGVSLRGKPKIKREKIA